MDQQDFDKKKFEYQMAQDMLKHYDVLNWHIGSILIAAVIILTGLVVKMEIIDFARQSIALRIVMWAGIPGFSLFTLVMWLLWFRRHRDLYNFRNEVLYRLEAQLGMFHFLRVVDANRPRGYADTFLTALNGARTAAGHDPLLTPILAPYRNSLACPSGYTLAWWLAIGIPAAQFVFLGGLLFL